MMPKQKDVEIPLLGAIKHLGGKARAQDVYAEVTKQVPDMTEADLSEQLASGGSKWTNRIQWVRQVLVNKGELDSPAHGVWAITAKGLARLKGAPAVPPNGKPAASANLEEIAEEYLS